MTDNVGLSTPRGSGTSGYIQRNLSALKPRQQQQRFSPYSRPGDREGGGARDGGYKQRIPDAEILAHERKRGVEVKVVELRDKLEEEGLSDTEIDAQTDALRERLLEELNNPASTSGARDGGGGKRQAAPRPHQVHELAEMKIKESERLRRALGIREGYQEGDYWKGKEREKEKEKGTRKDVEE